MNNKEFIQALAQRTNSSLEKTRTVTRTAVCAIIDELAEGNVVTLNGLGTFEVKKRQERVIQNPITKQKMLVPPKLVVNFKTAETLKDKIKATDDQQ